jgi:hypothetical protein
MQMNEAAIAQVFDEKSLLKLVDVKITDNGGLTKMFNTTAEMGPMMAASDPSGFNPLEGQTGASLRQMAGSMIDPCSAPAPDIAPFADPVRELHHAGRQAEHAASSRCQADDVECA